MGIGKNIKSIREAKGFTQADLAIKLGVSDKTVSSWENGRTEPKMGVVEKITVALGCLKSDIVGADYSSSNISRPLSPDEASLLDGYQKLNELGREKARDYIGDLTEQKKYVEKREGVISAS